MNAEEYVLVTYHIRDGEREHDVRTILTKEQADMTDEELIHWSIDNESCTEYEDMISGKPVFWVFYMEAYCYVKSKHPMTRETKELFNSYGVY